MLVAVVDDGEAADYDSRSLMQFCQSYQLLLGDYQLLTEQYPTTTASQLSASTAECDVKAVCLSHHFCT